MSELRYERDSKKTVYVSLEVYRWLWLLAKSEETIADSIADRILHDTIKAKHPILAEHLKKMDKWEAELIETLRGDKLP